jgi:hypothetical protein
LYSAALQFVYTKAYLNLKSVWIDDPIRKHLHEGYAAFAENAIETRHCIGEVIDADTVYAWIKAADGKTINSDPLCQL